MFGKSKVTQKKRKTKSKTKTRTKKEKIEFAPAQEEKYCFTRDQVLNIVDAAKGKKTACNKAKEFIALLKEEEKREDGIYNKR